MDKWGITDRRRLLKAGLFVLGADLFALRAFADEKKSPGEFTVVGRGELLKGLDGMSHVADEGNDPFGNGHNAAAVMSAAFFCREQKIDRETQKAILAVMEKQLLTSRIYAARPEEKAAPDLVDDLVAAVGRGQEIVRLDANPIQARLQRQLGEAPKILFARQPLFLNRVEQAGFIANAGAGVVAGM